MLKGSSTKGLRNLLNRGSAGFFSYDILFTNETYLGMFRFMLEYEKSYRFRRKKVQGLICVNYHTNSTLLRRVA